MAVPSAVTVDQIVTEALKRAGRTTPSATVISSAKAHQFREVKSDMEQVFGIEFPELYGELGGATVVGETSLALPVNTVENIESVTLYEPGTDTGWDDTMQAGSTSTTVKLAAALDEDSEDLQGHYGYIDGGTGSGQLFQLGEWNNTTKVSPITGTFATTPDGTSTYILTTQAYTTRKKDQLNYIEHLQHERGVPQYWAQVWGNPGPDTDNDAAVLNVRFDRVPDKVYPIKYTVQYALDYLDETGNLLVQHLRKYRSVWIQGVAAYSMQLYDEDRFLATWQIYQQMLEKISARNTRLYLMSYTDL